MAGGAIGHWIEDTAGFASDLARLKALKEQRSRLTIEGVRVKTLEEAIWKQGIC